MIRIFRENRTVLLAVPVLVFFTFFFIVPVLTLLALAFNPKELGSIAIKPVLTIENFKLFFSYPVYRQSLINSLWLASVTTAVCLLIGYPVAYIIARTTSKRVQAFLVILVFSSMQIDLTVRIFGYLTILGDNGLINGTLIRAGVLSRPLPLMYNSFGVIVGLVNLSLPFLILPLIGIIESISPDLLNVARLLGCNRWKGFMKVELPLSLPGIITGVLFAFAISMSSYLIPVLLGGWGRAVLPVYIYQQISNQGLWQRGAAFAIILLMANLIVVFALIRYYSRTYTKRMLAA
jgi:putative spermidine/putrescine transport system permease protein